MGRSLPPLNWVRAFEAAARHEGFARAAEELSVSPGAISQHVKLLEQRLGVDLFERHPRGVWLTNAGEAYRDALCPALDAIEEATRRASGERMHEAVRLVALPAVAQMWLTPRLPRLQALVPEVAVQLATAERIAPGRADRFDVAVHYESEAVQGLEAMPLFRDDLFPVCSPDLASSANLLEPVDLGRCQLLYDIKWSGDWALWCAAAGAPVPDLSKGLGFSLYSMAVAAAIDGQGMLIAHRALVARELESGRLVEPFGIRVPAPHRYVAIFSKSVATRVPVRLLVEWLRGETFHSA